MPFKDVLFGEKTELRIRITERDSASFTITGATVTITDSDGTKLRDGVTATVDAPDVYYVETFSATNSYTEGATYTVTFKVTITPTGSSETLIEKYEDTVLVQAVADE